MTIGSDEDGNRNRGLDSPCAGGMADKIDAPVARIDRSRRWIMKEALAAWIDQEEDRHKITLEALADVDAGRVIDHQNVQAWADSLATGSPLPSPPA